MACERAPTTRTAVAQLRNVANGFQLKEAMAAGYNHRGTQPPSAGGFEALERDLAAASALIPLLPDGVKRTAMAAELICIAHELKSAKDYWQRELGKAIARNDVSRGVLARQILGISNKPLDKATDAAPGDRATAAVLPARPSRFDPALWSHVVPEQSPIAAQLLVKWGSAKLHKALTSLIQTANDHYQYYALNHYKPDVCSSSVAERLQERMKQGYRCISDAIADLALAQSLCPEDDPISALLDGLKEDFEAAQVYWTTTQDDASDGEVRRLASAWLN
jgi:hypothetical protein